jgi:peptide/nickel transport system permease protein
MVLLAAAVETRAFPAGGMTSPGFASMTRAARAGDVLWHLALPALVLAMGTFPLLVRHVRAAMSEVLESSFCLHARAMGIPRRRLLYRHLLPPAAGALIPLLGFSLGTLLSASLLVEVVMGWPGLGPLFLEAIMARDFGVVVGVVTLSTAFLAAGNLIADLLHYGIDPRIRAERT